MSTPSPASQRATGFTSVLHPTDLEARARTAFVHALRVVLDGRGKLTLLHVGPDREVPWSEFPGIRHTLVRWGALPAEACRADLAGLGVRAAKLKLEGRSPVKGIVQRVRSSDADLLVLATHQRRGVARWWRPSIAEAAARAVAIPSLLLPFGEGGFVDLDDGAVDLTRVLVTCAAYPPPGPALDATSRLLHTLGIPRCRVRLLHVGPGEPPRPGALGLEGWSVEVADRTGSPVEAILDEARDWPADLVVVSTRREPGGLARVRGSTTTRLLERLRAPILLVPEPR